MIKPYYEDDAVVIYHGDCKEILPQIDTGSVDLVLTDPPYNVGIYYGGNVDDSRNDYAEWLAGLLALWLDIAPVVAVSTGIANIGLWANIQKPNWWLSWQKPAAMGRCFVGFNNWEPIALYGRPPKTITDSFIAPIVPDKAVDGHPCPKPLGWARWQVGHLSPEQGTILDPFMGSGTTLRAAKDLGRKAIGIEISEEYCAIAAKRMAQTVMAALESGAHLGLSTKHYEPSLMSQIKTIHPYGYSYVCRHQ